MTRDQLRDRIAELIEMIPQLTEVGEVDWSETPAGEPFVLMEDGTAFTGLDSGAIELIASPPNTGKVAVYRIEPDNTFELVGLTDDPAIGMQANLN